MSNFSFSHSVFKRLTLQTPKNQGLFGKGLTLYHKITTLTTPRKRAFENIVGKEENAGNKHFLPFSQCFLPYQRHKSSFEQHINCRLQMLSIWTSLKFCQLVKTLAPFSQIMVHIISYHMTLLYPFPNKLWFLRVCCTSLLKTLWKKKIFLLTSNFFFSQCFLSFQNFPPFSSNSKLSSANSFSLEESKIYRLGRVKPFPNQKF